MRLGLAPRVLAAGIAVLIVLGAEFAVLGSSFRTVGAKTSQEQRAEQSIVAAELLEKLLLDVETGERGYVLTHDPAFLAPWRSAQAAFPAAAARLEQLAPGPRTAAIVSGWRSYVASYSRPLVQLERTRPRAAAATVTSGRGKRLVDAIRARIDSFVRDASAASAADRARIATVRADGRDALVIGSLVALVLVVAFVAYVLRVLVAPLRRAVDATREVTAGRQVALPEQAPGEVGQLAVAFNEMSRSLTRSRAELAEQNDDLERLANLLRAVLDSTLDGILLSDRHGGVQLANRPMIDLARDVGMKMGSNVVDNLLSIADRMVDPETFRATMERLRLEPDEETFDEFELAGSGRVFQGFTAPVRDPQHHGFVGRIWTLREVTQQRELDRLKDDFVATVSHELRTPLTSMMGFLEILRDGEAGELTAEQERFLGIVHRSSERLQRLVGDLLFVARLDASGLQLQMGTVALHDVLRESADHVGALARSRELQLAVDAAPVPPLRGDRERIAQIVGNLLSNAVKFTPPGGRVSARTFVEGDRAVLEVEDTGIGIPHAEQDRLFERFFRSSTATEQAIPGTGLGLVIAKAIADAHGGSISVRSRPGEGTCFRVELPLVREEAAV